MSETAPSRVPRWLPLVATLLVVVGLAVLARQAATKSIDFPVYHRAAQQILAGNYELYPPEAYGGTPHPSQGFRYAPAIAFLFFPLGWFGLETAALLFYVLKLVALWWVGTIIARRIGYTNWGRWTFLAAFLVVGGYLAEELRFGNAVEASDKFLAAVTMLGGRVDLQILRLRAATADGRWLALFADRDRERRPARPALPPALSGF